MKTRISKTLESAMAQAVFNTAQVETRCSLKDCLILQFLSAEGSKAYRTLADTLQDWQLFQLRLRLERVAYRMGKDITPPDEFYKSYSQRLAERFNDEKQVSTLHAMIDILEDSSTIASKVFALYGISADTLRARLGEESGLEPKLLGDTTETTTERGS